MVQWEEPWGHKDIFIIFFHGPNQLSFSDPQLQSGSVWLDGETDPALKMLQEKKHTLGYMDIQKKPSNHRHLVMYFTSISCTLKL